MNDKLKILKNELIKKIFSGDLLGCIFFVLLIFTRIKFFL